MMIPKSEGPTEARTEASPVSTNLSLAEYVEAQANMILRRDSDITLVSNDAGSKDNAQEHKVSGITK